MSGELHDSKPEYNGGGTREFFTKWIEGLERLLEERDRRYEERFRAQETAVTAAFQAQKELNRIIADSSEKAITKSETAQSEYNKRSNEFRGALDDQNKQMERTMLSRNEYEGKHASLVEKSDAQGVKYDEKIDDLKKEIQLIRQALSKGEGKEGQKVESTAGSRWGVGVAIGIITTIILLLINLAMFVINFVK